jgi:hypothetical protein
VPALEKQIVPGRLRECWCGDQEGGYEISDHRMKLYHCPGRARPEGNGSM